MAVLVLVLLGAVASPVSQTNVQLSTTSDTINPMTSYVSGLTQDLQRLQWDMTVENGETGAMGQWGAMNGMVTDQITNVTTKLKETQAQFAQLIARSSNNIDQLQRVKEQLTDLETSSKQEAAELELISNIALLANKSAARSQDFQQNFDISTQWTHDLEVFMAGVMLPGSITYPNLELLDTMRSFTALMKEASDIESNATTAAYKMLSDADVGALRLSGMTNEYTIGNLRDRYNSAREQVAQDQDEIDSLLLLLHSLEQRLESLLHYQSMQSTSYAEQSRAIDSSMAGLSDLVASLRNLKTSICPHMCSGNGRCLGTDCICSKQYQGRDCSVPAGPSPSPSPHPPASDIDDRVPKYAFDFGRSTHTFISSESLPISMENITKLTTAVWIQPRGGGGASIVSYATSSRDSEWLLWMAPDCQALFLWVNSISTGDLTGIPVANFSRYSICDGRWHHVVVAWDGEVGDSTTYVDGKFWEYHLHVFPSQKLKTGGRIVLGHNQVHLETRSTSGIIPDAYLGVMSDFFFIPTAITSVNASAIYHSGIYSGSPYLRWSLNPSDNSTVSTGTTLSDEGCLGVNGMAFGGSWALAGDRVCGDA